MVGSPRSGRDYVFVYEFIWNFVNDSELPVWRVEIVYPLVKGMICYKIDCIQVELLRNKPLVLHFFMTFLTWWCTFEIILTLWSGFWKSFSKYRILSGTQHDLGNVGNDPNSCFVGSILLGARAYVKALWQDKVLGRYKKVAKSKQGRKGVVNFEVFMVEVSII